MVARGHRNVSIRRLETYNTRNLPELLGLGAAINFYNEIGPDKIHKRSFELKEYFRSKLENNSRYKLKSPKLDTLSSAIQAVEVIDKNVIDIKDQLIDDYGIACRPMANFGLNALRISLAIFITKRDIDYLVDSLDRLT